MYMSMHYMVYTHLYLYTIPYRYHPINRGTLRHLPEETQFGEYLLPKEVCATCIQGHTISLSLYKKFHIPIIYVYI